MTQRATETQERLNELVTMDNAEDWHTSGEKYLFCDELIASADVRPTMSRVLWLERQFEKTLTL